MLFYIGYFFVTDPADGERGGRSTTITPQLDRSFRLERGFWAGIAGMGSITQR
jgi:hypothetical protein